MMKLTGAQALIKSLEQEAVEVVFGLPGGCILPAYDPLLESTIRHILVRHEQGAGHMAEGYAHVTGRPGVALVTSGPAATNLVTPLMDAFMDSIPMVAITGQVPTKAIGSDAFQECDTVGITRSVTKHNELVMTAEELPMAIRQAFHIATTGRPGPVLVDVPKDVLQATVEWDWPSDADVTASLPGYRPTTKGHPRMIKEAAKLILASERPVIYAGGGILKARAADGAARAGRAHRDPRRHHADGAWLDPGRPPADVGHARHARQRDGGRVDAAQRPADHARRPLRRPDHRPPRRLRPRRQDHPRRHRSGRAGQGPPAGRADRRRLQGGDHRDDHGDQGPHRRGRRPGRHERVEEPHLGLARAVPADVRAERARRGAQAAVLPREAARCGARGHDPGVGRRPAPDVRVAVLEVHRALHVGELRWAGHDGLLDPGRDRRQGRPARSARCGPSTATAASR